MSADSDSDNNPYFPKPALRLTATQQKAHVEHMSKARAAPGPEKLAVEKLEAESKPPGSALAPIYDRIAAARRTSQILALTAHHKLRPGEQQEMARRLYDESIQNRSKKCAEIRQKYRPPGPTTKHIHQDGMDDLVLRLYQPPSAPSILSHVLHTTADRMEAGQVPHRNGCCSPGQSSFLSSDEEGGTGQASDAEELRQSNGLSGKIKKRHVRMTTVLTTSGTTVLACIKRSKGEQLEQEPESQKAYDAARDPHLVQYWKGRGKQKRRLKRRAVKERQQKEKLEAERAKRQRQSPSTLSINLLHQREMLIKEELHRRLIVKVKESDARRDIRAAMLKDRKQIQGDADQQPGSLSASIAVPQVRLPTATRGSHTSDNEDEEYSGDDQNSAHSDAAVSSGASSKPTSRASSAKSSSQSGSSSEASESNSESESSSDDSD